MLYTPLSSRVYVLQAISPVEIQPYSQRKRKRISLWGCIEHRRGREKNRLFLERRQSQEKNYSFHPERSSAIFIEKMSSMPCYERQPRWLYDIFFIEEMSSTFCYEWQPCLAVWYHTSFLFSFPGGTGMFDFYISTASSKLHFIVQWRHILLSEFSEFSLWVALLGG